MRKTTGWLLVVLGVLWVAIVLIQAPPSGPDGLGVSRLLGAITLPVLLALVGLYLAGVIKNAK
ncbi:hypothetical protein [Opitutus terrae]|uniref:Uncharacterized protein n=1 Tax=Opitutus terrae (strain DSM 11246 / JCM 15787 / PB90-1) TaxID=452637 RepID=B1ZRB9_OPITP|nr:hypothetical protein [Opitutus terrae]ACB74606.1 hypothetical protein Oter_1321 [Opitutus terrae PB90-1]